MFLDQLKPAAGSTHNKKRIARGAACGQGCTAGRGHKGQKSRTGASIRAGFEGGQMPLQRRLPKRGFFNRHGQVFVPVNLGDLERFEANAVVDAASLKQMGLIKRETDAIKVLARGSLTKALTVRAQGFSAKAKENIEASGGKVEVIPPVRRHEKSAP